MATGKWRARGERNKKDRENIDALHFGEGKQKCVMFPSKEVAAAKEFLAVCSDIVVKWAAGSPHIWWLTDRLYGSSAAAMSFRRATSAAVVHWKRFLVTLFCLNGKVREGREAGDIGGERKAVHRDGEGLVLVGEGVGG